jgi:alanine racemase
VSKLPFYRNTWVEVNLDHIEENIRSFKSHLSKETKIIAVVKADAYGHGAYYVAISAIRAGAEYLAVAILDEAIALRKAGVEDIPILVLGWTRPEDINLAAQYCITLTVYQKSWLVQAKTHYKSNQQIAFHVKFDTGMGRLGIRERKEAMIVIDELIQTPFFHLEGVYTHYATADEPESDYILEQMKRFEECLSWVRIKGVEPEYIHCGNSATALRFPDQVFNLVRIGISMYGLSPSPEMKSGLPFTLKEAFSFHSRLVHVKEMHQGETISYGATYKVQKDEWIGTVPVGYADGWIRKNAVQGEVLVNGKRAPIVGRICMDQFMIRLPGPVDTNTKVTLIGKQGEEAIFVDDIARNLETINYEIPCMISYRVPRVYVQKGKIVSIKNEIINFS